MNSPVVSIIIPIYDSKEYILDTLTSVCNQSFDQEIEIICVDNNSTDESVSLIKEFKSNSRFDIILASEEKQNASAARNRGLKLARGKYISFLDSDDWIHEDKIKYQVHFLQQRSEIDAVVSDRVIMNEDGSQTLEEINFSRIDSFNLDAAISNVFITGNPLYRALAVKTLEGYNEKLKVAQDWDFHVRFMLSNMKMEYLEGKFLFCRSLDNSLSSDWLNVSKVQENLLFEGNYNINFRQLALSSRAFIQKILWNNFIFRKTSYRDMNQRMKMICEGLTANEVELSPELHFFLNRKWLFAVDVWFRRLVNFLMKK